MHFGRPVLREQLPPFIPYPVSELSRTDPQELPPCSDLDRGHDLFFARGSQLPERIFDPSHQ